MVFGSLASDTQAKYQACLGILQGGFFNCTPLNLTKSQSLYKIAYSNFFSPILLCILLGLRQIRGGTVKKTTLYTNVPKKFTLERLKKTHRSPMSQIAMGPILETPGR